MHLDPKLLIELANARMPFGRFKNSYLSRIPEEYYLWLQHEGWPHGKLGQQMALMLDLKTNGLETLLDPLRRA